MTRPRADAWGICACGSRYRTSSGTGMCGKCRMRMLNAERLRVYAARARASKPTRPQDWWLEDARERASTELYMARQGGHVIPAMLQDTEPGTWIGRCEACGGYLGIDPDAQDMDGRPQPVYGSVSRQSCPGREPVPAAPRRHPDHYDAQRSGAHTEPMPTAAWLAPDDLNWADDGTIEVVQYDGGARI